LAGEHAQKERLTEKLKIKSDFSECRFAKRIETAANLLLSVAKSHSLAANNRNRWSEIGLDEMLGCGHVQNVNCGWQPSPYNWPGSRDTGLYRGARS
jgi:hypothetical protein